jgi:hypothetical protein
MPEPVSTTIGILISYAATQSALRRSSAVSFEAEALQNAVTEVVSWTERSQALFGSKAAVISSLRALASECNAPDWDGENANAMSPIALLNAENFIRALPDAIPLPELAPEPDGSVSLDWIQARNRLFSLSISSTDRLAFAWLDGSDKGHGVARFDGQTVPPRILMGIQSVAEDACLRAA